MLASFIIPAYNVSKTIVRCLDSIYALGISEQEFEVICIDDCSIDNTIEVIEQYSKLHTNIMLLCQSQNHRQGAARNRGVSIAKGKYIVFVDSDDESDKGVLDTVQLSEEYQLDMVAMHYVNVDEFGNISKKEPIKIEGVFSGVELQTQHPYWGTAPCSYIYKSDFLRQVNYPFVEDVVFEDSDFIAVHLYHAKRMMYSAKSAYRVHYNATSTTRTLTYKHIADYILLGNRMLKFYHSLNDTTSQYSQSILEGGSYNVWISCKRLFKLSSIKDVYAFYDRLDSYIDRKALLKYSEPAYCWTWWTKLCLRYKHLAITLIAIGQLGYKFMRIIRK
jgi:glycosyltransferase involved in cell wall biosynthesis